MPLTDHVPRAIFGADVDWEAFRYVTEIKGARPIDVLAARRYQQEEEAITVVNASWELVVDCFRLQADDEVGPIVGYRDVLVTGAIQFYLPDNATLHAQVVSARLKAAQVPPAMHAIGG